MTAPPDTTNSPRVSACVIAADHAGHIGRCLASLSWADERLVVLDARSSDATDAIARAAGARVIRRPYEGNVEQKNFAVSEARGEWVVALDADEALSRPLAAELRRLLRESAGCDGFELNRVTWHLGRWIRHGDFYPDWQLRVFRRAQGGWAGRNPHGRVRVPGRVRRITGDLEHYSYDGLSDQVARIQEFSDIEAARMQSEGRPVRVRDLVLRPPARFLRAYLLKGGYRDGVAGLIIAWLSAFHVFLKYAKLRELDRRVR